MLALVQSRMIVYDQFTYFPEQHRLLLNFTNFEHFNRLLQLQEINVTPGYCKSSIIVRAGWRQVNRMKLLLLGDI